MKAFLLFSSLLIANIITPAQAMDEAQYNEADARYLAAVNGNKNSVQKAIRYFDKLTVPTPYNTLIKSYRGSLESIMATHVYMPWNKMKHVELGSEQMDEALDELTEIHDTTKLNGTSLSLLIRLNIAHSYFQFPSFLNRYQDAKDLISDMLETPQFSSANIEVKNNVYELAATTAGKDGDKQKQTDFLSKIQSDD
ncbi:hypothetical protein MNBD_GAMMA18-2432 [hydrothermal vent metagenome]|uniref:Uncharacterized protein n=1 Tax=hydrothermal vent metagenome TaxID=652676 RepID=A0A3B0ZTL9_9ZZZZ